MIYNFGWCNLSYLSGTATRLVRYVATAAAARIPDAGASVGLVLLIADSGGGGIDAGLFTICLNLPHLVGPVLARRLDRGGDGRPFIATCCVGYGAALAAAALSIGGTPLIVSLGFVVVAGICGPVLTAGLSSQLSLMVPQETSIQRRAQGLDALTYGVAGSVGPAIVASIATGSTPLIAVLALSGTAVVAGVLMMMLPAVVREDGQVSGTALGVRQVLAHVVRAGGLRRAMIAMMMISFVAGSLAILAVGRGTQLRGDAGSGALLVAAYGAGSLAGSVFTGVVPLRGEPDRNIIFYTLSTGVAFVICGVVRNFEVALTIFALAGFLSGPFFVATLAVRTTYSPTKGRAQVFVAMGALKITLSAAGAAVAGAIGFSSADTALVIGGAAIVVVSLVLVLDRYQRPAVLPGVS